MAKTQKAERDMTMAAKYEKDATLNTFEKVGLRSQPCRAK